MEKSKIMLGKNFQVSKKFKDNLIEGSICLDILDDEKVKALVYEYEGKRYLNVRVVKRQDVTKYYKTHYLEIDQIVPTKKDLKEIDQLTNQLSKPFFSIYTGAKAHLFPFGIVNVDFHECLYYLREIRKVEPGSKVIVWMYIIGGPPRRLDVTL